MHYIISENVIEVSLHAPFRHLAPRRPFIFHGVAGLRLVSGVPRQRVVARAAHQAHAHQLQAPPAAHHEVILRHQPEPRRQGSEAAGAEDWTL